jgi:hypothetical protein
MKSELEKNRMVLNQVFQPDDTNRAEFQPDVTMLVCNNWHGNVRTEKSKNSLCNPFSLEETKRGIASQSSAAMLYAEWPFLRWNRPPA